MEDAGSTQRRLWRWLRTANLGWNHGESTTTAVVCK